MYPKEFKMIEIEKNLKRYNLKKKKKNMKIFYIAGPYRADTPREILENIRAAEKVAIYVWKHGNIALCPHLNSRFMDGICAFRFFGRRY